MQASPKSICYPARLSNPTRTPTRRRAYPNKIGGKPPTIQAHPVLKAKSERPSPPRPDLKPDSPEAPRAKPPQREKEETDKEKDGKSDTDGKKSRQPSDTKDLCEKHPDILACDPVPKDKRSASEPDFSIPTQAVDLTFSPDSIFPENGVCPAPVQFEVSIPFSGSKSFALDYQWICAVAVKLRMLLIAVAWLVVAVLVTKSIKQ